jgi:uncharacterized repeat protein (TIGR01451 family)
MHARIAVLTLLLALTAASPASAETQPPQPTSHLTISTTSSHRTIALGAAIAFTITIANTSAAPAVEVTVCDQLPASITRVLRTGGLRLYAGTACRTFNVLQPNTTLTIRVIGRIGRHARAGVARNRALAIWSGRLISATSRYRIVAMTGACHAR